MLLGHLYTKTAAAAPAPTIGTQLSDAANSALNWASGGFFGNKQAPQPTAAVSRSNPSTPIGPNNVGMPATPLPSNVSTAPAGSPGGAGSVNFTPSKPVQNTVSAAPYHGAVAGAGVGAPAGQHFVDHNGIRYIQGADGKYLRYNQSSLADNKWEAMPEGWLTKPGRSYAGEYNLRGSNYGGNRSTRAGNIENESGRMPGQRVSMTGEIDPEETKRAIGLTPIGASDSWVADGRGYTNQAQATENAGARGRLAAIEQQIHAARARGDMGTVNALSNDLMSAISEANAYRSPQAKALIDERNKSSALAARIQSASEKGDWNTANALMRERAAGRKGLNEAAQNARAANAVAMSGGNANEAAAVTAKRNEFESQDTDRQAAADQQRAAVAARARAANLAHYQEMYGPEKGSKYFFDQPGNKAFYSRMSQGDDASKAIASNDAALATRLAEWKKRKYEARAASRKKWNSYWDSAPGRKPSAGTGTSVAALGEPVGINQAEEN